MLTLEGVDAFYGDLQALHGVSLEVRAGELMALVGANAAGKTTTLRVISGTLPARAGRVLFEGQDLAAMPAHLRVAQGIIQVPEGRRLFPFMTVNENLLLGAHAPQARAHLEAHAVERLEVAVERVHTLKRQQTRTPRRDKRRPRGGRG